MKTRPLHIPKSPESGDEEDELLLQTFRTFDTDGNGVDLTELSAVLRSADLRIGVAELRSMMRQVGRWDLGPLTFPEFKELVAVVRRERGVDIVSKLQNNRSPRTDHLNLDKVKIQRLIGTAYHTTVIMADSVERWCLDFFVVFATGYHAMLIPSRFADVNVEWPGRAAFEWTLVVGLLMEVAASFFTSVFRESWFVDSRRETAIEYLKTWFVSDLIGSLPLDLVADFWGATSSQHALVECLHLLRLFKFRRLFRLTPRGLIHPRMVWFKVTVLPFVMILWWVIVSLHVLVIVFQVIFEPTPDPYLSSAYQVIETLTTVGYGDVRVETRAQKVYASFLFVLGVLSNGYIVSRITNLLVQADLTVDRDTIFKRSLAVMNRFDVPVEMQREVLSYQFHDLMNRPSSTFKEVTESLPPSMSNQILIFVRVHIIQRVPQFADAQPECQVALAQALDEIVAAPMQPICVQGERGHEMYFLMHGFALVHDENGQILSTLTRGSFFGHVSLVSEGTARNASVTSLTFAVLLRLQREHFNMIRVRFTEFDEKMRFEAEKINNRFPRSASSRELNPLASTPAPAVVFHGVATAEKESVKEVETPSSRPLPPRHQVSTSFGDRLFAAVQSAKPSTRRHSVGSVFCERKRASMFTACIPDEEISELPSPRMRKHAHSFWRPQADIGVSEDEMAGVLKSLVQDSEQRNGTDQAERSGESPEWLQGMAAVFKLQHKSVSSLCREVVALRGDLTEIRQYVRRLSRDDDSLSLLRSHRLARGTSQKSRKLGPPHLPDVGSRNLSFSTNSAFSSPAHSEKKEPLSYTLAIGSDPAHPASPLHTAMAGLWGGNGDHAYSTLLSETTPVAHDDQPVSRVVVTSFSSHTPLSTTAAQEIGDELASKTEGRAVTGLLAIWGMRFYHLFEGTEDAVRNLESELNADARHCSVTVQERSCGNRLCIKWSAVSITAPEGVDDATVLPGPLRRLQSVMQ